jgi:hypothetical protein
MSYKPIDGNSVLIIGDVTYLKKNFYAMFINIYLMSRNSFTVVVKRASSSKTSGGCTPHKELSTNSISSTAILPCSFGPRTPIK